MNIKEYIKLNFNGMTETLDRLIRIPSVRGEAKPGAPFGEAPLAVLQEVLRIASEMGFYIRNYDNRLAVVDLYGQQDAAIGILCHADVVAAGTNWAYDPFRATRDNGKIYGRGAIDDKGPLVSALYALKYLKEQHDPLKHNVRLIVGTDEECGSEDLAYYRERETLPEYLFTPDASYPVINTEKGRATGSFSKTFLPLPAGRKILSAQGGDTVNAVPDKAYAVVSGFTEQELRHAAANAPSGVLCDLTPAEDGNVRIGVSGKRAHASLPETGINAITALLTVLGNLDTQWNEILRLFPHGETNGASANAACADEVSGALTFAFTVFSYREEHFTGTFDIRFPICINGSELKIRLECALKKNGITLDSYHASEPHHTKADSLLVRTLLHVYEAGTGLPGAALAIGGGTYAHGIPGAAAFGPELPGTDNHMHAENEFISEENFRLTTELICEAITALDKEISFS